MGRLAEYSAEDLRIVDPARFAASPGRDPWATAEAAACAIAADPLALGLVRIASQPSLSRRELAALVDDAAPAEVPS